LIASHWLVPGAQDVNFSGPLLSHRRLSMASSLYNRYVPPKPVVPPPAVKKSVTQAVRPPKDRAWPARATPEDGNPAPNKEKSKKRKSAELVDETNEEPSKRHKKEKKKKKTKSKAVEAADDHENENDEPSKRHKTVFTKFEQSSKLAEELKKKKKKSKALEEPEPVKAEELHGTYTQNWNTRTDRERPRSAASTEQPPRGGHRTYIVIASMAV
jgi:hypothetical protein